MSASIDDDGTKWVAVVVAVLLAFGMPQTYNGRSRSASPRRTRIAAAAGLACAPPNTRHEPRMTPTIDQVTVCRDPSGRGLRAVRRDGRLVARTTPAGLWFEPDAEEDLRPLERQRVAALRIVGQEGAFLVPG